MANRGIQRGETRRATLDLTGLAGPLTADLGGTGVAAYVQGDILYASGSVTLARLAKDGNATRYLSNTGGSNNPAWAQINLADGVTGRLPFANLTQGSALSLLGVTGNAVADLASIVAATDHQVMRRSGTAIAFGAVDLSQAAAVTGVLPAGNLPTASETAVGIVEIATNAEAVTGTDTTRAIVPSSLTARLAAPGPIGGTTPAAISGTTGTLTGLLDLSGASAGQISFPATQNPSAGANVLDDYEEGTWTVTDVSGAALSFTTVTGNYVKVGKLTFASCGFTYPATADATAAVWGGLPFTINNSQPSHSGGINFSDESTFAQVCGTPNTTTTTPRTTAGGAIANSVFSGNLIRIGNTYIATA